MFRQLVQASCRNRHDVKVVRLSLLMQVMDKLRQEEGHDAAGLPNTKFPPLKPQGFVFHEARCGSTTVANSMEQFVVKDCQVSVVTLVSCLLCEFLQCWQAYANMLFIRRVILL